MKICPIILNRNNLTDKGQMGSNFKVNNSKLNYQNQNDVFIRLAISSTRDSKIEHELKEMNLI